MARRNNIKFPKACFPKKEEEKMLSTHSYPLHSILSGRSPGVNQYTVNVLI